MNDCMHDLIILERTWQTISYANYQKLDHSEQVLVCQHCGYVVNPWVTEEVPA